MIPLGKIIIVRPVEDKKEFSGVITSTAQSEFPDKGIVVSIGSNVPAEISPAEIKEGDTILFRKGTSTVINVNDEDLLIMDVGNVWIIL